MVKGRGEAVAEELAETGPGSVWRSGTSQFAGSLQIAGGVVADGSLYRHSDRGVHRQFVDAADA